MKFHSVGRPVTEAAAAAARERYRADRSLTETEEYIPSPCRGVWLLLPELAKTPGSFS